MRLERATRGRAEGLRGAIVPGALVLAASLSAAWLGLGLPRPACAFRMLTGLPCATCGTTRLVRALLLGDLGGALSLNPLVFFVLVMLAAWGALSAARLGSALPGWRLALAPRERAGLVLLTAAAVIGNWIYLVLHDI